MLPPADVALPRGKVEPGRIRRFPRGGCAWPFLVRKTTSSQTAGSTTNLVGSTATIETNTFSTEHTSGYWYKIPDPRYKSIQLTASDGKFQQAGIECFLADVPYPVRLWLDALLDTGTTHNFIHETTLRKYGLHHQMVNYKQPRSAQRLVVALLQRFGLASDHDSPPFVTCDNHQIPIIGEINLSFKWKEQDGKIFNDKEHTVNFKVIHAPNNGDASPTWPLILGEKYMEDMRICVLCSRLNDDHQDVEFA